MTAGSGWRSGTGAEVAQDGRFGVRCRRCARTQPPHAAGAYSCAYCGAPLPIRRWIAHPPPGVPTARRVTLVRRPYSGPPSYRGTHPTWGFPLVTWRGATVTATEDARVRVVRGQGFVAVVAAATAVACLVAAVAEGWRFSLMLAGRTNVLPGGPVHDSDVLVVAASVTSLVLGLVTVLAAVPLLVSLHRAAAQRAGRAPSRSAAGVVARLMVPGWNLYGAGQVLMEIVGTLAESDHRRRSSRITAPLWWLAWVANGLLVVATLIMAFGRRLQIVADTVQMHIAVDLVAAVVAGMFAAVIASVSRAWAGRGAGQYGGWSVRQPESTARNRINRMAAPSTEAAPATVAAQEDRAGVRGGRAEVSASGDEVSASGDEVSASGDDVPAGADELPAIGDRTPAGGGGAPADARSGDEEPSNAADLELSEAPSPGSADPDVDPR